MPECPTCLLCFDFDGTLVHPNTEQPFNPLFLEYMTELKKQGAVWVINTGRTLYQLLEGLQQYKFDVLPDYIIAREQELYQPGQFHRWQDLGDWNQKCLRDHQKLFRSSRKFFQMVRDYLKAETAAQYTESEQEPAGIMASTEEEMDVICAFIDRHEKKPKGLGYQRNSVYFRFGHVDYNKGTVMAELGRHLCLQPANIFAVGDNHNDLPMLDRRYAQGLACPLNALPVVKDCVAKNNGFLATVPGTDGVIEALHFYFYYGN